MKRLLAVLLLSITACTGGAKVSGTIEGRQVDLPDGTTMMCVVADVGFGAGLTCDWDNRG